MVACSQIDPNVFQMIKINSINHSVSIIVPTKNERGNIRSVIEKIPQMGKHTEIIFVEGGSKDCTWEEIIKQTKLHPKKDIKYFQQESTGKADAVRKGFSKATGDVFIIFDADMTVSPKELPKFFRAVVENEGELIIGSRLIYRLNKKSMPAVNILGNKFFALAFSWLLNQKVTDTLCGTKALSKTNYKKLLKNRKYFGERDPFGDFDLILGASKQKLKILEIPVHYHPRKYGDSNISRFKHGILLLKMAIEAIYKIKFVN